MIANRAGFTYGPEGLSEFTAEYPVAPWTPIDDPLGITRWTASGAPGPVIDRRDSLVTLPLRIQESEWLAFVAFLEYAQTGAVITWYPDADDTESFPVYLEAPLLGAEWRPTVNGEYSRMFDLEITLRGAGIALPWREYFGD